MELEELCGQIYRYFLLRNFQWRRDGELFFPSIEEIKEMILRCSQTIEESKESISVEIGNLLIKGYSGKIDVYMYVGEVENGAYNM